MTKEKELFVKEYPPKKLATNPFNIVEAIGYLKHLKLTSPEQSEWIDNAIRVLLQALQHLD